ncbi:MAG: hypothetical protein M1817_006853 [Caeruleum heppii]|nr:MAG: hypothetical protein M1817_006853 [Caeruleum heppii]
MTSTGVDRSVDDKMPVERQHPMTEKGTLSGEHSPPGSKPYDDEQIPYDSRESSLKTSDFTHRKLKPRHVQLIGIGGTIGTALFVQIGNGLIRGGPASLFLAFTIWCTFILAVTNCTNPIHSDHSALSSMLANLGS